MSEKTRVITGTARLSYAHIWEPYGKKDDAKKYSAMLLIPKEDTETLLNIKEAGASTPAELQLCAQAR